MPSFQVLLITEAPVSSVWFPSMSGFLFINLKIFSRGCDDTWKNKGTPQSSTEHAIDTADLHCN
jgi:hypothetical protein